MMKITGLSHFFKWENLHNWWLTKYFFSPLCVCLQSTSRQDYPLFCLTISRLVCLCHKVFLFISTTYPPSSEARASSFFDFVFFLLASNSCCRLEAISLPAFNCLMAHLTADCSDAACCQSLRQNMWCQITHLFISLLPQCSTCASWQQCASFAHLQRVALNTGPRGSWGTTHSSCSACREGWR